jgi:hypothetical protein
MTFVLERQPSLHGDLQGVGRNLCLSTRSNIPALAAATQHPSQLMAMSLSVRPSKVDLSTHSSYRRLPWETMPVRAASNYDDPTVDDTPANPSHAALPYLYMAMLDLHH